MKLNKFWPPLVLASLFAADVQAAYFNRISSFPVASNLAADEIDKKSSAGIIAATADGQTLVYSDSPRQALGLIDISDPASPEPAGRINLEGEPTSVAVFGQIAYTSINTSVDFINTSGQLLAIDLTTATILANCALNGQPDSIAITADGSRIAVAIENERDEDHGDGVLPQLPAGNVVLFDVHEGQPDCESRTVVNVSNLSTIAPNDPEPEYIDFNSNDQLIVSLQENNHFVVIDGNRESAGASLVNNFSAGTVTLNNVDLEEEGALTFDGVQADRLREPDAVKWLDTERFVSANEGDYEGGTRGFTIFSKVGEVLYESGLDLEYRVAQAGHYPEKRSGNNGIEPGGLEIAKFADTTYIFVLAERASVIGVYKDTGGEPEFLQLLPTALRPESAVAIPSRNLLAVANKEDLVKKGGTRSHVTLYQYGAESANYPSLVSEQVNGRPIGWGALSGLTADPERPGILYAVNDGFYTKQPRIFTIDAHKFPATITSAVDIKRNGAIAQSLDLEGIVSDGEDGFWLASEGRTDRKIPHVIVHVDANGNINEEIPYPNELLAFEKNGASEGITLIDNTLWLAIQRPWKDDADDHVKLLSYNLDDKSWGAVSYPLDKAEKGRNGLSEITAYGDHVYIVERDNQIGSNAKHKKLFKVAIAELKPVALGSKLPVLNKKLARDFLPDLLATRGSLVGKIVGKIEGFTVDSSGNAYVVTDNDGVDDSNGETLFFQVQGFSTF